MVERDLELLQPLAVGFAGVPGRLALPQLVLLGDELLDRPMNLRIVHHTSCGSGSTIVLADRVTESTAGSGVPTS